MYRASTKWAKIVWYVVDENVRKHTENAPFVPMYVDTSNMPGALVIGTYYLTRIIWHFPPIKTYNLRYGELDACWCILYRLYNWCLFPEIPLFKVCNEPFKHINTRRAALSTTLPADEKGHATIQWERSCQCPMKTILDVTCEMCQPPEKKK